MRTHGISSTQAADVGTWHSSSLDVDPTPRAAAPPAAHSSHPTRSASPDSPLPAPAALIASSPARANGMLLRAQRSRGAASQPPVSRRAAASTRPQGASIVERGGRPRLERDGHAASSTPPHHRKPPKNPRVSESLSNARTRRVIEQAIRRAEGFVPRRMPKLTNDDRIAILRDGRAIDVAIARATREAASPTSRAPALPETGSDLPITPETARSHSLPHPQTPASPHRSHR